jgi:sec-independent protein translocase protein TatC
VEALSGELEVEKKMTVSEHLDELRQRLIKASIALAVATLISLIFAKQVFHILIAPAPGIKPIFIEVTEMLSTYFKVSLLSGAIIAMPVVVYQIIMFIFPAITEKERRIFPAITEKERRYLYFMLPGVVFSFLVGAVFAYLILLPPALRFLLTFASDVASPEIRIGNYISTVTTLIFWIGVVFEMPIVLFFLARIGLVSPSFLSRNRKYALVLAFVLAAFITPTPDPVNQSLVALPLIVLYEVGVLLTKVAYRRRE